MVSSQLPIIMSMKSTFYVQSSLAWIHNIIVDLSCSKLGELFENYSHLVIFGENTNGRLQNRNNYSNIYRSRYLPFQTIME